MPTYVFDAPTPEDFLDFGRLNPGDQITTDREVEHPRLRLIEAPAPEAPKAKKAADTAAPKE